MYMKWVKDENGRQRLIMLEEMPPEDFGPPPSREELEVAITAERDRRLLLPFEFGGKAFQRDPVSVARINGAVSMALAAMALGTAPDAPDWANGGPFRWIAADNSVISMTPAEVVSFGLACAEVERKLVFAARQLKDQVTIPDNFANDEHWT